LEEADHAVRGTGELRGLLRVALSSSLAVREIVPQLPVFMEHYPELRVELVMSDQRHLSRERRRSGIRCRATAAQ